MPGTRPAPDGFITTNSGIKPPSPISLPNTPIYRSLASRHLTFSNR